MASRQPKKIYYRKLVRDRIPDNIARKGSRCEIRKLNKKEFERELLKKVGEEASGLLAAKTKTELVSELADVSAVLDEIKKLKNISNQELAAALRANFARKGGFGRRLFLVWSSDDNYRTNERKS